MGVADRNRMRSATAQSRSFAFMGPSSWSHTYYSATQLELLTLNFFYPFLETSEVLSISEGLELI